MCRMHAGVRVLHGRGLATWGCILTSSWRVAVLSWNASAVACNAVVDVLGTRKVQGSKGTAVEMFTSSN